MYFQTMHEVLTHWAIKKPEQKSCVFLEQNGDSTEITYFRLEQDAKTIAAALQQTGAKPGDRVLLVFSPGLDLIKAFWGCLYANLVAVLVHPPLNKKLMEKTHRIIHNCSPKILLLPEQSASRYADLFEAGEYLSTKNPSVVLTFESIFASRLPWQCPDYKSDDIALLQYTSGSTNSPKGVIITHGNLIDNLEKIKNSFEMNESSIMLGWLPPYHDMGLMGAILSPFFSGYPTYLMTPFAFLQNPLSWLQYITKYQITISGSPNFAYDYCVKRIKEEKKEGLDLSSWKVAFNGAEPIHYETMRRFYDAFKDYGFRKEAFYPCYGLAEATLLVASGQPLIPYQELNIKKSQLETHCIEILAQNDPKGYHLVSCGTVHHDIRIIHPETLEPCPPDTIGEIWINSKSVSRGYWNQPEETQEAFVSLSADSSKRFLRTGDLGFIHNEALYVTGRIKDLIILYGKNHYPQDIETSLKYCSFHDILGNNVAFVVSKNNEYLLTIVCELRHQQFETDELEALCNRIVELIYHEHTLEVSQIILVRRNAIPQTTSGKVKRRLCKELINNSELPIIHSWNLTDQ